MIKAKKLPASTKLINKFEGVLASRLSNLGEQLDYRIKSSNSQNLLTVELAWLEQQTEVLPPLEFQRYRTLILILRDILNLSWQLKYSELGTIEIIPPTPTIQNKEDILTSQIQHQEKERVRQELLQTCQEQFRRPATQKFIQSMETPSRLASHISILHLLADGKKLAARLNHLSTLAAPHHLPYLEEVIQPYLELVDSNSRDEFTKIKYSDIWRYFRLSWVIPNTCVPGRNLFYLVRDAAQPMHPIMAIAALSNAALQLKDRDDFIGWTRENYIMLLEKAIKNSNIVHLASLLNLAENYVNKSLSEVDTRGFVTGEELAQPSESVIKRLDTMLGYYNQARQHHLEQLEIEIDGTTQNNVFIPPQALYSGFEAGFADQPYVSDEILLLDTKASRQELPARRQMILKKRAHILCQLLSAKLELQKIREADCLIQATNQALHRSSFLAALTTIIRAAKSEKIGVNMLEITTCGAIPPYNHLLGGKLMSLLLLSPKIAQDYKQRYGDKYSVIASQVKGEKLVRDCQLAFLSTTSLYGVGSSQYNRLSLPAGTFHPDQPELLYRNQDKINNSSKNVKVKKWQTTGFGTVQFSKETSDAVVKLGKLESGYQEINNIFGEGSSPKLRKMREGLEAVGLAADVLLRHHQPRLLYCIELAPDSRAFLRGEEATLPEYLLDPSIVPNATNNIINYWRKRWLFKRLFNPTVLTQIANFNPTAYTLTNRFLANSD